MDLRVRLASLNDVREIVEVHCSDVEKWFRWVSGRRIEAEYEELSIEERFMHGGPWMSVETCAIHLNNILTWGQYPLVAEVEGRVVGELELYVGDERGDLGRTAFIDVLVVHKEYRRRGIGTALVRAAKRVAIEEGCCTVSVWPEEKVVPFYRKCDLGEVAYKVVHTVVDAGAACMEMRLHGEYTIEELPQAYNELRDLWFITPRIYSAFTAWLKSKWRLAIGSPKVREGGWIPEVEAAFILESLWWPLESEARLTLWVRRKSDAPRVLAQLCRRAGERGFRKLHLLIESELVERCSALKPFMEVKGREVVLMGRLKETSSCA
ncbi:MAG: GNAT family N-acetyltransferase [Thermoprotei archaeon]|nr:MAG: GNAT family N-acetyltransferase [Thermoprotei archaeon]